MKTTLFFLVITVAAFSACNLSDNKATEKKSMTDTVDSTDHQGQTKQGDATESNKANSTDVINAYLQLKNALTKDNSAEASKAGASLQTALTNFDTSKLTDLQIPSTQDVLDDAKEHAEHINKSSGNIAHQREHFEMLSKDIYDLAKAFKGEQVLYKDFCPMYNNNKGAYWISETKEIKNPYLGKAMPTCGVVKEQIK